MRFAIMRAAKLGSAAEVRRSLRHAFREQATPNADASRTRENVHHGAASSEQAMTRLRDLLPAKRRKDAVLAVEYVLTASPEWWQASTPEQRSGFFERAQGWVADKYGADRIVVATEHHDETSPHLSVFVVPLTIDGRLSAREFIGGKAQMSADQDSFHAAVAGLGLERGIKRSKAQHVPIREFYGRLAEPARHAQITPELVTPQVLKKGFMRDEVETAEAVANRVTEVVKDAYGPAVEAYRAWRGSRSDKAKAAEARKQAEEAAKSAAGALKQAQEQQTYLEGLKRAVEAQVAKFDAGVKRQAQLDADIDRLRAMRDRERGLER